MTDQTDRIKQMAQEAGFDTELGEITAPHATIDGDPMDVTEQITRLIALVAEDCARVVADETNAAMDQWGLGMDAYHASERAEQAIRARYAIAKPPEAG